jgi:hypothetical protein
LDTTGVSRFQLLQRRGAGGRSEYAIFDLLEAQLGLLRVVRRLLAVLVVGVLLSFMP